MGLQEKERIRMVADLRLLFPELLLVLGAIEGLPPPQELSARIRTVRAQLESLMERARAMEEATDCMPAAVKGRQNERGL